METMESPSSNEGKTGMDVNDSTVELINRRSFLAAGAGILFAGGLCAEGGGPSISAADAARKKNLNGFRPLELRRIRLEVGASKPFKAVHVSDTHIVRADATDKDPRKVELAAKRCKHMRYGEHYLNEAVAAARRDNALLLHTGDMIDFVSNANLDLVGRYFGSDDWFVSSGNHEFSKYVGEAREDAAYKADSYDRVSAHYPNDLTFASRVVNGINFVAIDDVYYNLTESQLALMEKEVAKGLPIVILCHVPFYTPRHHDDELKRSRGLCSYQTGVPDDKIATWRAPAKPLSKADDWRDRRIQQRADAPTREFIKYIKAQPLLKAILCGHCHRFWEERFSPTAVQYVCGATFQGQGYAIDFA